MITVVVCALAGCWEEIHYTAPPPSTTPASATSPVPESPIVTSADASAEEPIGKNEAADFGNDLAKSLAATEIVPEPVDRYAITETDASLGESSPRPAEMTTDVDTSIDVAEPPVEPTAQPSGPTDADVASRSPRRTSWSLGSTLSLAVLGNDRALDEQRVANWFETAHLQAKLLGTTVTELPPRPTDNEVDREARSAVEYLLVHGQHIGQHLIDQYGDDHAALFELAVKSNMLLVLYQPGAPVVKTLTVSIEQAGERAQVPAEMLQPLVQLLDAGATPKEVRNAVFALHENVDRYLSTAAP